VLAAAGTVTMFGNTVTISNITSPNGAYAPYQALVDGILTTVICDDPFDTYSGVQAPANYQANVTLVPNVVYNHTSNTLFAARATSTNLYNEIAYLSLQFSSHPLDTAAIQTAIWYIVDHTINPVPTLLSSLNLTLNATAQAYVTAAQAMNYPANYGANVMILTPVGKANSPGRAGSQEFLVITPVPEPGSYAMLGSGIILLSLLTFRRKRISAK
jgi:hypothetical protein